MMINQHRVRSLKIEPHCDGWRGKTKPKIRLIGRWLENAGFMAGQRVQVVNTAPGILELRCPDTPSKEAKTGGGLKEDIQTFH